MELDARLKSIENSIRYLQDEETQVLASDIASLQWEIYHLKKQLAEFREMFRELRDECAVDSENEDLKEAIFEVTRASGQMAKMLVHLCNNTNQSSTVKHTSHAAVHPSSSPPCSPKRKGPELHDPSGEA